MRYPNPDNHIAVLIDAENVSPHNIEGVLQELSKYGTTSVRRIYGDWSSQQLAGWKAKIQQHSLKPQQQFTFTKGKNSSDIALVIDAMDLLHISKMQGFAIVSSDSDFIGLAQRLREAKAHVYGFGNRNTPEAFRNACATFHFFDALEIDDNAGSLEPARTKSKGLSSENVEKADSPPQRLSTKRLRQDTALVGLLRSVIAASEDEDGWAQLSLIGATLRNRSPEFDPRNWGYAKLKDLIKAVDLFEVSRVQADNGHTNIRVRIMK